MTNDAIKAAVLRAIARVAPEVDLTTLDPGVNLRDQLDLDSVDFMNVVVAIHADLGIDVPEADYPKLTSLDACVAYLAAHGAG
ncbi:MAG TPA: acyl carrier protein [Candidatus Kryptonia bacterium]|nr:acyl carrier protein [Candidatus Kryptonia bacterium]